MIGPNVSLVHSVKHYLLGHLFKAARQTPFWGTTTVGLCRSRERLNTTRTSGDLQPRSRMGVSGWQITRRKHPGYQCLLAKLLDSKSFAEGRPG